MAGSSCRTSALGVDHAQLPTRVAGAMRIEALVVAACAEGTDRGTGETEASGLRNDELSEIDRDGTPRISAGELSSDVGADLVAASADRRSTVQAKLTRRKAARGEQTNRPLGDARGGA